MFGPRNGGQETALWSGTWTASFWASLAFFFSFFSISLNIFWCFFSSCEHTRDKALPYSRMAVENATQRQCVFVGPSHLLRLRRETVRTAVLLLELTQRRPRVQRQRGCLGDLGLLPRDLRLRGLCQRENQSVASTCCDRHGCGRCAGPCRWRRRGARKEERKEGRVASGEASGAGSRGASGNLQDGDALVRFGPHEELWLVAVGRVLGTDKNSPPAMGHVQLASIRDCLVPFRACSYCV